MTDRVTEHATVGLRWRDGKLQQRWDIYDLRIGALKVCSHEWRDVPYEVSTPDVKGVGKE